MNRLHHRLRNSIQQVEWSETFAREVNRIDSTAISDVDFKRHFVGDLLPLNNPKEDDQWYITEVEDYHYVLRGSDEPEPDDINAPLIMNDEESQLATNPKFKMKRRRSTWAIHLHKVNGKLTEKARYRVCNARLRFISDIETTRGNATLVVVNTIDPSGNETYHELIMNTSEFWKSRTDDNVKLYYTYILGCIYVILYMSDCASTLYRN